MDDSDWDSVKPDQRRINLYNTGRLFIPDWAFSCTYVRVLELEQNNINSVPPEICQLTNLLSLSLTQNDFTEFSQNVCLLTSLLELYLDRNSITKIPEQIGNLRRLKTLDLAANKITDVPVAIAKIQSLYELYLGDNLINTLSRDFFIIRLVVLDLQNNPLQYLPAEHVFCEALLPTPFFNPGQNISYNKSELENVPAYIDILKAAPGLYFRLIPRDIVSVIIYYLPVLNIRMCDNPWKI